MKKVVFITLLCISVSAIGFSNTHSQKSNVYTDVTNMADTTPKTMHHKTMMKKTSTDTSMHKSTMKMKPKPKMSKDSTRKK